MAKNQQNARSKINHLKYLSLEYLHSLMRPQEGRKSMEFASPDTN